MFKALRRKIKKNRTVTSNAARSERRLHDVVLQPAVRPGAPRMKEKDVISKNDERVKHNIREDPLSNHNSELEDFKELLTSADINARFEKDDNTNNRIHNEHYVYDSSAYRVRRGDSNGKEKEEFDVFAKPGGVTPAAVRYVVFHLVACFMEHLDNKLSKKRTNETYMIRSAMEIFKPNLSHYSSSETQETKQILSSFFPCDGCSLAGETLKAEINRHFKGNWNRLILALRLVWSHLSEGIIPWESFLSFRRLEDKHNFPLTAFYTYLPQVLPSSDHTYLTYSFLEILVAIIGKTDLVVEKATQMDLIFTAGQVCFAKNKQMERYRDEGETDIRGSVALGRTYYTRGAALYHLFVAYLRSLMDKGLIKDFYLIDNFNVGRYPPEPYKPMMQQALTLTVPKFQQGECARNDFNRLLKLAAKASTRIYSSQHAFSKVENTFLDQFEEDPARTIATLFSKSSIRYLYKFDKGFNTNYLKTIGDKNSWNRALQELDASDQYAVATWIESCKQHGFNEFLSILDNSATGEATLALGSPQFTAVADELFNDRNEESHPVRISKMGISEWFISSWKYEMFLGKIHNTVVVKLTKRIGNCDWLVISTDDRVLKSEQNMLPNSAMNGGISQRGTPKTPSMPEFGAESPRNRIADQVKRHRPPPLNLLGQTSTSPLMADSASSLQLRKSSVAGSVTTKDMSTEEGSISENRSGVTQGISAPSSVAENAKGYVDLGDDRIQPKLICSETKLPPPQVPTDEPGGLFTPTNPNFDYTILRPAAPKKAQNPSLSSFKKLSSEFEIPVIAEEEPDVAVNSNTEANDGSEASFYTVSSASDALPSNTSDADATRTECASSVEVRHISKPVYFSGGIANADESQTLKVTSSGTEYSRRQTPIDFQELSGDAPVKEVATPGSRGTMLVYPKNEDYEEEANHLKDPKDTKHINKFPGESQTGTIQEPGDFLDDFIEDYKEGTATVQKIESISSGENPTLFEKVKQYYENIPAANRENPDSHPEQSESADISGNAISHEEVSVNTPTTPTAPDAVHSKAEYSGSGFSINDAMTTIEISPLKICPPKAFLGHTSSDSDSVAEQPVSRFKNVLLKTKKSIRDLGNSLSA